MTSVRFEPTPIRGAHVVKLDQRRDERGFFARAWCSGEFTERGLVGQFVQMNTSFTFHAGTLRGFHYQTEPSADAKFVRCVAGAIFDVVVDMRAGSPTRYGWFGVELSADNRQGLYVPAGCGHGFQTLHDSTEVFYQVSAAYNPEAERGFRWDDPAIGVQWPIVPPILSDKDQSWPDVPTA